MGATHSTGTNAGQSSAAVRAQQGAAAAGQFAQNLPDHLQKATETIDAANKHLGQMAESLGQAAQHGQNLYGVLQQHVAAQKAMSQPAGTVGGGAAGFFGGDESDNPAHAIKEYRESLASASKARVITGLARALKHVGIDVDENASAQQIVDRLQSALPDPKKGTTFAADAASHKDLCEKIGGVLNNEFTPGAKKEDRLIDLSMGPASVCRQVSDIVHSMSTGLHTEFLEVHASLTRVLKNLDMAAEILEKSHNNIMKRLEGADLKTGADKEIQTWQEIYSRARREFDAQILMLKNFMNVTLAPAAEELALAMREEGEGHEMIKRLKLTPGTGDFADSLARAVSGLGTIAAIAARVDSALSEVGMSVQDYLSQKDMSTLEKAADEKLMNVDPDDLANYLKAVSTLKENFYRRSELDLGSSKVGGATLDRRVEKRRTERKIIVKEFIDKSTRQYDALLKAVQELGPKLGKQIPLSDKLETLRNALARLSQSRLGALNLELALIGYYSDAAAREKKETFVAGLRVVEGILDELMGVEMYRGASPHFAAMRSAIEGLVRTIDYFSDAISKKFGSAEEEDDSDDTVTGGQPSELSGLPELARSSYDLERAVNTFLYFYYVAKVRSNLAQTHKELESYGEDYTDILGDAVASRLRQLEAQKALLITGEAAQGKAKEFRDSEYKCKAEFYRALQALDLYMKAFTEGIVANPDDVQDIKRILDGVEVIGRWFVEDTGDDLAQAFDMMPSWDGAQQVASKAGKIWEQAGEHYYEKIASSTESNGQFVPGVPQMAIPVNEADAVKRQINKVFDNFQALKNIMNAFVRIGDKFGGKELRRQVFMSPYQIYRALLDYMKCSAISMGVGAASGAAAGPIAPGAGTGWVAPSVPLSGAAVPVANEGLKNTGVYFGSVQDDMAGNYAVEDRYFSFCVKAMAAKILTVIGVYDLFERPSPVYELTPVRMIIGGSDYDTTPEAIPEASELYFRLPRLVEFYKDLFGFDRSASAAAMQISMLPEMDGVFSGIIRLIFQRVEGGVTSTGDYSDMEMNSIVREINSIYDNFRGAESGSVIGEALSAFVMEINRRYGLVKKTEWESLQKLLGESRRGQLTGELNRTNYAILPDEDEYQTDRRAPSDRYMGPGEVTTAKLPGGKHNIDDGTWVQWKMLKNFREKLDKLFEEVKPEEFSSFSFGTVIRQGEMEMRRAEGVAGKFTVAARLIQGSGSLAGVDVGKAFMFHETVVVGLNLLNAIYTMLYQYRQRVIDLDVSALRAALADYLQGQVGGGPVNAAALRNAIAASGSFSARAQAYVNADADGLLARAGAGAGAGSTYALLYGAAAAIANGAPAGTDLSKSAVSETLSTYGLNSSMMMNDLITVLTGLTSKFQGLVQVRFPGTAQGQIHLDFSGVRGLVQNLMDDVRYYMDMFRPYINKSVIQKFEGTVTKEGSLYWLEDKLLDKLVRGLPDDMAMAEADRAKTLEWMSRKVNQTYANLVGFNEYTLANMTAANVAANPQTALSAKTDPGAATADNYEQFGRLFASIIYYDAMADGDSGLDVATVAIPAAGGIDALISAVKPQGAPPAAVYPSAGGAPASARANLWTSADGLTNNRSMLLAFNQILAKFIRVFYDSASGKIYRNLINGFASGAFSRAVMSQGNSLPDMYNPAAIGANVFGRRGDPTANGILCQSLALILQRLVTDISPTTQVSDHLVATLSDIPLYIRESYRANLPAFSKLFELIQQKGDFLKQLMSQTRIQVGRPYGPQSLAAAGGDNRIVLAGGPVTSAPNGPLADGALANSVDPLAQSPPASSDMQLVLSRVIDGVAAGCYSLSNAAVEVMRELADEPLYLQTHEHSIEEYRARNGKEPLMPLSSALTFLRDLSVQAGGDTRLMPVHSAGDEMFKFMYGTRKMLGRSGASFTLADAPGVRTNIETYNGVSSDREKIDVPRFEAFLGNAVSALRYVVDTRNYQGILAPVGATGDVLRSSLVRAAAGNAWTGIIDSGPDANAAYPVRAEVTPQKALSVTESTYQDQEMKAISDVVGGSGPMSLGQDRKKEWIYNIIDMNIVPINVHALMRGIPLAPLYNYVYTFEQMSCLLFGEQVGRIEDLDTDVGAGNGLRNTRQMFLKLLIDPYAEIPMGTYGPSPQLTRGATNALVQRIFRGDDSLNMGRPKFLSDQLYNKALFGSLTPTPYSFDEAGPSASGRMEAGYRRAPTTGMQPPMGPVAVANPGLVPAGQNASWGDATGATGSAAKPAYNPAVLPSMGAPAPNQYGALTFISQPDDGGAPRSALKQVGLGNNAIAKLESLHMIGKARFDTRMVRNMSLVTNVQRMLRLKLSQELSQYRNVLVSDHGAVNPGVTEYGYIPPSNLSAPRLAQYGPRNETSSDRRYDNETKLVA